jgi:hypothetical protein
MTKIWHDWEFLEDGRTIRSISVGIVAADDREYYGIFDNGTIIAAAAHPWLRANVLPHLPVHTPVPGIAYWDTSHPDYVHVNPPSVIAAEVLDFIRATPDPELWAWYAGAGFDHVNLAWLYGPLSDLPSGIPKRTNDLKQEAIRLGDPRVPAQTGPVHHALHDARHDRDIDRYLTILRNGEHS